MGGLINYFEMKGYQKRQSEEHEVWEDVRSPQVSACPRKTWSSWIVCVFEPTVFILALKGNQRKATVFGVPLF